MRISLLKHNAIYNFTDKDRKDILYIENITTCDLERLGTVHYFVNGWLCEYNYILLSSSILSSR